MNGVLFSIPVTGVQPSMPDVTVDQPGNTGGQSMEMKLTELLVQLLQKQVPVPLLGLPPEEIAGFSLAAPPGLSPVPLPVTFGVSPVAPPGFPVAPPGLSYAPMPALSPAAGVSVGEYIYNRTQRQQ